MGKVGLSSSDIVDSAGEDRTQITPKAKKESPLDVGQGA